MKWSGLRKVPSTRLARRQPACYYLGRRPRLIVAGRLFSCQPTSASAWRGRGDVAIGRRDPARRASFMTKQPGQQSNTDRGTDCWPSRGTCRGSAASSLARLVQQPGDDPPRPRPWPRRDTHSITSASVAEDGRQRNGSLLFDNRTDVMRRIVGRRLAARSTATPSHDTRCAAAGRRTSAATFHQLEAPPVS